MCIFNACLVSLTKLEKSTKRYRAYNNIRNIHKFFGATANKSKTHAFYQCATELIQYHSVYLFSKQNHTSTRKCFCLENKQLFCVKTTCIQILSIGLQIYITCTIIFAVASGTPRKKQRKHCFEAGCFISTATSFSKLFSYLRFATRFLVFVALISFQYRSNDYHYWNKRNNC